MKNIVDILLSAWEHSPLARIGHAISQLVSKTEAQYCMCCCCQEGCC